MNASNDPLIVIDGLAIDNEGIKGMANGLSMVNPADIETFTVLESISSAAKVNVDASELNNVLIDLWTAINGEQAVLPTEPVAVYIRLKANITGSGRGVCLSNVIELPKVLISKSVSSLTPPKTMFITGSMLMETNTDAVRCCGEIATLLTIQTKRTPPYRKT